MNKLSPFILSLGGIMSDYITTRIGLSLGLYEMYPAYHPLKALLVFWGMIAVLSLLLPKERFCMLGIKGIALSSYLGAVNNTLVILGVFSGLQLT